MKKLMVVLMGLVSVSGSVRAEGGGATGVGGAGNETVAEFYLYVRAVTSAVKAHPDRVSSLIVVDKLARISEIVRVSAEPSPLLLDGKKVDAINYPEGATIAVDDKTWIQLGQREKYQIVVHELLGLMRVGDPRYEVSQAITDATFSIALFHPVSVNSCVDSDGRDIYGDVDAILALLRQQPTCNAATALAKACSWGTSADVRKAWTAYRICENELAKDKPTDANLATLKSMEDQCEKKYAALHGTMYESLNAYCHLSAMNWIVELSTDWSN